MSKRLNLILRKYLQLIWNFGKCYLFRNSKKSLVFIILRYLVLIFFTRYDKVKKRELVLLDFDSLKLKVNQRWTLDLNHLCVHFIMKIDNRKYDFLKDFDSVNSN